MMAIINVIAQYVVNSVSVWTFVGSDVSNCSPSRAMAELKRRLQQQFACLRKKVLKPDAETIGEIRG